MSRQNARGVLIAGLILIALGILFFLNNWIPAWSVWGLISRYWPVLLILIGLRSLYHYFTYTPPSPSPPAPAPVNRPEAQWPGPTLPPER